MRTIPTREVHCKEAPHKFKDWFFDTVNTILQNKITKVNFKSLNVFWNELSSQNRWGSCYFWFKCLASGTQDIQCMIGPVQLRHWRFVLFEIEENPSKSRVDTKLWIIWHTFYRNRFPVCRSPEVSLKLVVQAHTELWETMVTLPFKLFLV